MSVGLKGRLEGRVAIVTGASRGIGRATAITLAREGASVLVNDASQEEKAKAVVDAIKKVGRNAWSFQADVGDNAAVERMVQDAVNRFNRIDILVNNAGIFSGKWTVEEFDEQGYDRMWRTNVKGVLYCTRAVAQHMVKKRYGKIVNIASIAGIGTSSLPGNPLYASTKAAVIALTKRIALQLGQHGINVNAIAPGLVRTDMGMNVGSARQQQDNEEYYAKRSMLGRIGEPEDVANAALFLASEEANFITGQIVTVDGGRIDFTTRSA